MNAYLPTYLPLTLFQAFSGLSEGGRRVSPPTRLGDLESDQLIPIMRLMGAKEEEEEEEEKRYKAVPRDGF
jgi:hypothetical protein